MPINAALPFNPVLTRERARIVRAIAARGAGDDVDLHRGIEELRPGLQPPTQPRVALPSQKPEPHSARRKVELRMLRIEDEMIRLVNFKTNIPRAKKLARIGRICRLKEMHRDIALALAVERPALTLSP